MERIQLNDTKDILEVSTSSSSDTLGSSDRGAGRRQGRKRRRNVLPWLYCFSVLVLIGWVGYLHYQVFEQSLRQEDMETRLEKFMSVNNWDADIVTPNEPALGRYHRNIHDKASIGDSEEDMLRSAQNTLESATKTLNDATQTLTNAMSATGRYHPSIQLNLVQPVLNQSTSTVASDKLVWTDKRTGGHSTTSEGKYTGTDQFFEFDENRQTIRIQRTGRYVVYAQMTYSGRQHVDLTVPIRTPECSFSVRLVEHIRVDTEDPVYGLLFGSVTQHSLGRVIHQDIQRRKLVAHDTVYTSGVFILKEGESISLISGAGTPCDVKNAEDKTVFGAYLLSERY